MIWKKQQLLYEVKLALSQVMLQDVSKFKDHQSLVEQGLDSILGVELVNKLNKKYNLNLRGTTLFEYPTISDLVDHLAETLNVDSPCLTEEDTRKSTNDTDKGRSHKNQQEKKGLSEPQIKGRVAPLTESFKTVLKQLLSETMLINPSKIVDHESFTQQGLDSILGLEFIQKINQQFDLSLQATVIFEYPNINQLNEYLSGKIETQSPAADNLQSVKTEPVKAPPVSKTLPLHAEMDSRATPPRFENMMTVRRNDGKIVLRKLDISDDIPKQPHDQPTVLVNGSQEQTVAEKQDIAVIGMASKFPGANTMDELWEILASGSCQITEVPGDHWDDSPWYTTDTDSQAPNTIYCNRGGFIDNVDKFDPLFFNISPREADFLDPQLRILLQVLWETVEDAGQAGNVQGSRTGLYLGKCFSDYLESLIKTDVPYADYGMGNSFSMLSNRAAFCFDLKGPNLTLDTACSSSLVALHLACQALHNDECEMAFAGGVNLNLNVNKYLIFSTLGAHSKSGQINPFDDSADGYISGEGVATVLLKPLRAAMEDNDRIYGVIKGSAIVSGGQFSVFSAPNPNQETEVIIKAMENAGVEAESISYIEAHGTGTILGDPLEFNSICKAFAGQTEKKNFCTLGTIKGNIGHTEATAGVAGVIKVLLQMKHELIPNLPNFRNINHMITLEGTPFNINTKPIDWIRQGNSPRRAGVSSFGLGGTYAHVILQDFKPDEKHNMEENPVVIVLSARSRQNLDAYIQTFFDFLKNKTSEDENSLRLDDIAYTLQIGRASMDERIAFVVENIRMLKETLLKLLEKQEDISNLFSGNVRDNKIKQLFTDHEGTEYFKTVIREKRYHKLAQLWTMGVDVDWTLLYQHQLPNKVSLPTYQFSKHCHWIDQINQMAQPAQQADIPKQTRHFLPKWEPVTIEKREILEDSPVLVIYHQESAFLKECLESRYKSRDFFCLKLDRKTQKQSDSNWCIQTNDKQVLADYISSLKRISTIYYLTGIQIKPIDVSNNDEFKQKQEKGTLFLFYFLKAVLKENPALLKCQLKVITNDVCRITGKETLKPYAAGLHGFIGSLAKEFPHTQICAVDISADDLTSQQGVEETVQQIMLDSFSSGKTSAYRNGRKYVQILKQFNLPKTQRLNWEKGSTVLILGGAGGIGLELSNYLFRTIQAKLVLLGRSELNNNQKQKVEALQGRGAEVYYIQADALSLNSLNSAVNQAKVQVGKIDYAIHCAIHLDDGILEGMSEEQFQSAMAPKTFGAINMYQALKQENLRCLVFFSSVQSFSTNIGQSNYAAACTFEDAFANFLYQDQQVPVKVLNWGFWGDVGIVSSEKYVESIQKRGVFSIKINEGMETFQSMINSNLDQLVCIKADANVLEDIGVKPGQHYEFAPQKRPSVTGVSESTTVSFDESSAIFQAYNRIEKLGAYRLLFLFQNQMDAFNRVGERTRLQSLQKKGNILPEYSFLFDTLLAILEKKKWIKIDGEQLETLSIPETNELRETIDGLEEEIDKLSREFPEIKYRSDLLRSCLDNYPKLLSGKLPATDLLFPEGSMELLENVYKNNHIADFFNRIILKQLNAVINQHVVDGEQTKLGVLEIGAGTGGTSFDLFEGIKESRCPLRYTYSDVSKAFLQFGQDHCSNSFVEFKLLDIEKDVVSQGFKKGEYDVVICSNVLHATRNIRNTLNNVKLLLKQNGLLILNEAVQKQDYNSMIFGLLDGWWGFEDPSDRIQGAPLLSTKQWEHVLEQAGFVRFRLHTASRQNKELFQNVFTAESNGLILLTHVGESEKRSTRKTITADEEFPRQTIQPQNADYTSPQQFVVDVIKRNIGQTLRVETSELDIDVPYTEFGIDSILAVEIIKRINEDLGTCLRSTDLFNYATIKALHTYIINSFGEEIKHKIQNTVDKQNQEMPQTTSTGLENECKSSSLMEKKDSDILSLLKKLEQGNLDVDEVDHYMEQHSIMVN